MLGTLRSLWLWPVGGLAQSSVLFFTLFKTTVSTELIISTRRDS